MTDAKVSILMLTFNAPRYVAMSIRSTFRNTDGVDFELVVLDNASGAPTRRLVERFFRKGMIDTLRLLERNSLFAEGNNLASELVREGTTHFLLLNSDVKIRRSDWLVNLLAHHRRGATSYGLAGGDPMRLDGYCYLIDADLYRTHPLDQSHQWWWAVSKQQATLLREGHSAQGFLEHERWLHHYGGKSGDAYRGASGMVVSDQELAEWFSGSAPERIDP